jgi:hypothetical protein
MPDGFAVQGALNAVLLAILGELQMLNWVPNFPESILIYCTNSCYALYQGMKGYGCVNVIVDGATKMRSRDRRNEISYAKRQWEGSRTLNQVLWPFSDTSTFLATNPLCVALLCGTL